MIKLSLRFLNYEHGFNYRVALEIGLIIGLIISFSAVITGLSGAFSVLVNAENSGPGDYLVVESGMNVQTSKIPLEAFNQLPLTYLDFKLPFLVAPIRLNGMNQSIYYTNLTDYINSKSDFNLYQGNVPNAPNQYLIGLSLSNKLGLNDTFPQTITVQSTRGAMNLTITGTFLDSGPWFFSFMGSFNQTYNSAKNISFIKVLLKNKLNLPVFVTELHTLAQNTDGSSSFSLLELKQSDYLANSFFFEILQLFNIMVVFLFVLMALKLIHSAYTILNRLKNEYLIIKILGLSNSRILLIFWLNLAITGNIGVLFGILVGVALPQLLIVMINPFFKSTQLILVPCIFHIFFSIIVANIIFLVSSFSILFLKIEDFKG